MAPSSNEADQQLSRTVLIALVIGSMVGSGIVAFHLDLNLDHLSTTWRQT